MDKKCYTFVTVYVCFCQYFWPIRGLAADCAAVGRLCVGLEGAVTSLFSAELSLG